MCTAFLKKARKMIDLITAHGEARDILIIGVAAIYVIGIIVLALINKQNKN